MISRASSKFWQAYKTLPADVREKARKSYKLFQLNSSHPSLMFKKIHTTLPIYSCRVDINFRAVGIVKDDSITWFWIGNHNDYDRLIKSL